MPRQLMRHCSAALVLATALAVALPFSSPAQGASPRIIRFSGYDWTVKASTTKVGPGPNFFSASKKNVWVDASGALHLKITAAHGHWYVAEVFTTKSLGYGTYKWVLDSRVDHLDANAVLGMFTYNDTNPAFANREIDIEAARWGNRNDPTNAQFVVQPFATRGNLRRITQGSHTPATFSFTWTKAGLTWSAPGASPPSYRYAGKDRPPAGGARPHINLWLYRGHAPRGGQPTEVIIRTFTFTPARAREYGTSGPIAEVRRSAFIDQTGCTPASRRRSWRTSKKRLLRSWPTSASP